MISHSQYPSQSACSLLVLIMQHTLAHTVILDLALTQAIIRVFLYKYRNIMLDPNPWDPHKVVLHVVTFAQTFSSSRQPKPPATPLQSHLASMPISLAAASSLFFTVHVNLKGMSYDFCLDDAAASTLTYYMLTLQSDVEPDFRLGCLGSWRHSMSTQTCSLLETWPLLRSSSVYPWPVFKPSLSVWTNTVCMRTHI